MRIVPMDVCVDRNLAEGSLDIHSRWGSVFLRNQRGHTSPDGAFEQGPCSGKQQSSRFDGLGKIARGRGRFEIARPEAGRKV